MRMWIVLPAYNEAENLPVMFEQFKKLAEETYNLDFHIILVDDGSSDETCDVAGRYADQLSVEIIKNDTNMGLAKTFMRGMTAAAQRAHADDVIICMDADNSHLPGQIPRILQEISQGRDVVIASRYQHGSVVKGVPVMRRLMSRGMSILFRLIYPIKGVRDYSCGFRAYRADFFQKVLAKQKESLFIKDGFACMVGILLRLAKEDAIFGEVPIILRYDQKAGASKMKVGNTVFQTLKVLLRERLMLTKNQDYQQQKEYKK